MLPDMTRTSDCTYRFKCLERLTADEGGVYLSGATIRRIGHEILTMEHEHLVTIGGHTDYQFKVLVEGLDYRASKRLACPNSPFLNIHGPGGGGG